MHSSTDLKVLTVVHATHREQGLRDVLGWGLACVGAHSTWMG
jgi:hypothetical protein